MSSYNKRIRGYWRLFKLHNSFSLVLVRVAQYIARIYKLSVVIGLYVLHGFNHSKHFEKRVYMYLNNLIDHGDLDTYIFDFSTLW